MNGLATTYELHHNTVPEEDFFSAHLTSCHDQLKWTFSPLSENHKTLDLIHRIAKIVVYPFIFIAASISSLYFACTRLYVKWCVNKVNNFFIKELQEKIEKPFPMTSLFSLRIDGKAVTIIAFVQETIDNNGETQKQANTKIYGLFDLFFKNARFHFGQEIEIKWEGFSKYPDSIRITSVSRSEKIFFFFPNGGGTEGGTCGINMDTFNRSLSFLGLTINRESYPRISSFFYAPPLPILPVIF